MRPLAPQDADFVLRLFNEPNFKRFVGDKNLHTESEALAYIEKAFTKPLAELGFALLCVELKESGELIGISGLVKRDSLDCVDLGFGFLQAHYGKGYASESALAVLEFARAELGLTRLLGITSPDNIGSIKTLEKVGFVFEERLVLAGYDGETSLFSISL